MIIYFDLHRPKVFKEMFEKSGESHISHYRNGAAFILARTPVGARLPAEFTCSVPDMKPDDGRIIVFDTMATRRYLEMLCRKYPDKRIILWYWNPIKDTTLLDLAPECVERWTYSEKDSVKYGIKLNTQFFFDCLLDEVQIPDQREAGSSAPSGRLKAFFMGREKGRSTAIGRIRAMLEAEGVETDFRIVPLPRFRYTRALREKLMPYDQMAGLAASADILVDYYNDPEAGISLRAMEALFFRKKLITNNSAIMKADFYDSRNIFVLGQEERSIKEFLHEKKYPVPENIRNRYLFSEWLKRF